MDEPNYALMTLQPFAPPIPTVNSNEALHVVTVLDKARSAVFVVELVGMSPAKRHMERVASVGCCVCRRLGRGYSAAQVHHVASGSSIRSDFAVVGLCEEHHDPHRTGSGFHGMGTKRFCSIFKVPGETEWGLLAWTMEDLERYA
jgi:hypothetical protein